MRSLIRFRPSPAMVVACLALLVSLAGTSVAAVSQLAPRNSVATSSIRAGAVTTAKLRNGAVTTVKLRNFAVGRNKLARGAVNSQKVANGSLLRADFAPNQLPYTKAEVDSKLSRVYTKSEADGKLDRIYTKSEVDAKLAPIDDALTRLLQIVTANGVGNNLGCAPGTLAVRVRNAKDEPRDARFTFQVPGTVPAHGQIRSGGSIRSSSANVSSVTHEPGSGIYCVVFSGPTPALESAVVSLHVD